jgi:EpsI family protein
MSAVLQPASPRRIDTLRTALLLGAMLLAAWLGHALQPTRSLAAELPPIDLQTQVPRSFAGWQLDESISPVLPDPTLQARIDSVYSQTLARTYVNARGERVMLTIAYGSDQSSEATAVHRPEFCYSAQGFRVKPAGEAQVPLAAGAVTVQRLVATLGGRVEPISYWVTLDREATLPGVHRKLTQLRYGLSGLVADGMLVRVSTIDSVAERSYAAQDRFLHDLADAVPAGMRARYFGS